MFWKALPERIWWFGLFLIGGLAAAVLFILGVNAKSNVTAQIFKQQQMLARAEASNISSFFENFGNSVALLAKSPRVESLDNNTQAALDSFVSQWGNSGLVAGVALTDAKGVVKLNSNVLGTHDTGASVADRDYFKWAQSQHEEGEYFIGTAVVSRLGGTKGQTIVPVVSPVFKNGIFVGAVITSAKLQPLTEHYLELMKVEDLTDVYLIGQVGDILFDSAAPDKVGVNAFNAQGGDFFGNQSLTNVLKDALSQKKEGNLQTSYLDPKSGTTEAHLITYSPVALRNRNWLLVVALPAQQVSATTNPVYMRQIGIFLLFALSILSYAMVIARENRKREVPQNKL